MSWPSNGADWISEAPSRVDICDKGMEWDFPPGLAEAEQKPISGSLDTRDFL